MEQPLPPNGACLLGSIDISKYISNPFTEDMQFDFGKFAKNVGVFSRLLDNVVESNGLPLPEQRAEIEEKRRHGMGLTGIGSTLNILGLGYGTEESLKFVERIFQILAVESYRTGIELAKEKGCAPIFNRTFEGRSAKELWVESKFMEVVWELAPELKEDALKYGCRYSHAISIAPTGTISLTMGNNVSNGIEPSFSLSYTRNVIKTGRKAKVDERVYSYESLLWNEVNPDKINQFPDTWVTTDELKPIDHVNIQAIAQKYVDSSISKTINVPANIPFEDFKDVYIQAYNMGLKGCTTFRFNPEAFSGVLVKDNEMGETYYEFQLEDGSMVKAKGDDRIQYEGDEFTAQNLFDAIKEGYYGKY